MPHDKSRGGRETRKPKANAKKGKQATTTATSAVSTVVHPTTPHPTHTPK